MVSTLGCETNDCRFDSCQWPTFIKKIKTHYIFTSKLIENGGSQGVKPSTWSCSLIGAFAVELSWAGLRLSALTLYHYLQKWDSYPAGILLFLRRSAAPTVGVRFIQMTGMGNIVIWKQLPNLAKFGPNNENLHFLPYAIGMKSWQWMKRNTFLVLWFQGC